MTEPKKLIQTRLYRGDKPEERGNCLPTVFACFMGLDSPEDAFQVQELYHDVWYPPLLDWLASKGWEWGTMKGHLYDGSYYLVSGKSPRGVDHICIYQNGKLWHDPHPSGDGILEETYFEYFQPVVK